MRDLAFAVGLLILLAGCTGGGAVVADVAPTAPPTSAPQEPAVTESNRPRPAMDLPLVPPTSPTADPTPTPTPEPAPTSPPAVRPVALEHPAPTTMAPGDFGVAVRDLQERLVELGYWMPLLDGDYGPSTEQAVMAFQKVEGIEADGVAGPATLDALTGAARPAPAHPEVPGIEIDLARQVMFVVHDGAVAVALNTSTGREGWRTRAGTFSIYRQINGWRHAPLGTLYRPKYFNGGIAMHGSGSIPNYPASHGCARLSNAAMDMIWEHELAPVGTTVTVY